ncbi:hypothetical protein [Lactobacillus hominis]|uniref:hypothetical protein n=1 Tax=Lactobacillus hominis TaxID=1203033 RepID=UPI0023F02BEA|nr:hypothetical protein [Lactobacillus hominis]
MKKRHKYSLAMLASTILLLFAGCQNHTNQSSSKSRSLVIKKQKSKKNSKKLIIVHKKQSTEEKMPTVTELMNNVADFNEGNFDIRINNTTEKGYDTGVIQENPRIVHYKFNGGMSLEIWTTDKDVYTLEGNKWIQTGQTYRWDRFDPITNVPVALISQMKVSKSNDGYKVVYQGNSQEVKELMEKYIIHVTRNYYRSPWEDQDFTSATLTYTFNKQKRLIAMNYEWSAGTNRGTAAYTNINQQKLAVPNSVIQAAANNPDSVDNQNNSDTYNDD